MFCQSNGGLVRYPLRAHAKPIVPSPFSQVRKALCLSPFVAGCLPLPQSSRFCSPIVGPDKRHVSRARPLPADELPRGAVEPPVAHRRAACAHPGAAALRAW